MIFEAVTRHIYFFIIMSNFVSLIIFKYQCLAYFARLTKLGSVNAKPVYKFMLAMKSPSSEAFKKAIDACAEAGVIHLEAMAQERYAVYLNAENNGELVNEYITSAYLLYQDWGAHAKALQMSQQYPYLKVSPYSFQHAIFISHNCPRS